MTSQWEQGLLLHSRMKSRQEEEVGGARLAWGQLSQQPWHHKLPELTRPWSKLSRGVVEPSAWKTLVDYAFENVS